MHLSQVVLDTLERRALHVASDPYRCHQFVLEAFPESPRGGPGRVLFRVEPEARGATATVLVQSDVEPEWAEVANKGGLAIRSHACKEVSLSFRPGQRLRFRLRANPTVKRNGKRLGLVGEQGLVGWLRRKGEAGGFVVGSTADDFGPVPMVVPEGAVTGRRPGRRPVVFHAVRFEGVLEVNDPERFLATIGAGVGSAKAFGFGLLSVAPE